MIEEKKESQTKQETKELTQQTKVVQKQTIEKESSTQFITQINPKDNDEDKKIVTEDRLEVEEKILDILEQQETAQSINNKYIDSINDIQKMITQKIYLKYLSEENAKHFENLLINFSPYVFNKFKKEKQNKIELNLDFFNLKFEQNAYKNQFIVNFLRKNVIFHARIACLIYSLGYGTYFSKYHENIIFDQKISEVKDFLSVKRRLQFSFDQNVFITLEALHKNSSYASGSTGGYYSYRYNSKLKGLQGQQQTVNLEELKQKCQNLTPIIKFLKRFGFTNKNHQFYRKMKSLRDQSYRIRYIEDFAFYCFKNKLQMIRQLQNYPPQIMKNHFSNIQFYMNNRKISYARVDLQGIFTKKATDYNWLQTAHDYIQWLFPNHFQSNFNSQAYALSYIEAQMFKKDKLLGQRMKRSFQIYLDFIGCEIIERKEEKNDNSIKIVLQKHKKAFDRLEDALIFNTHNHLRIMRILACLSVTGFRLYAQEFIRFLQSLADENKFFGKKQNYRSAFQRNWRIYSFTQQNKLKALQMCFIPYECFPLENEYLKAVKNNQKKGSFQQQNKQLQNKKEQPQKMQDESEFEVEVEDYK